ncbi:MAG: hypothetical protein NC209_08270 [Alistipes sp.]|nr:hypothetical protein [Alistipes senegalensis]MCM1251117.1 hypothetical protein [Alistipes sp.]
MKLTKSILLAACAATLFGMAACQKEEPAENNRPTSESVSKNEALLSVFAEALSKATYNREDVREFLKEEAVKQFDKNYDVLYALVKDKEIGGSTFRDILVEYSSEAKIAAIEENIPLLNILVPKIAIFGIAAENMDCTDPEIPVAVSKAKTTSLYLNGECAADLEKGEIPDFHTFVVNENSRVIVDAITRSGEQTFRFISPNYDGSIREDEEPQTRSTAMTASEVGSKAVMAYNYFYTSDSGSNSRTYQRDYIYYGITPANGNGTLNRLVSEYISFLEVDPKAYFKIADQKTGEAYEDPYIKANQTSQEKRALTNAELLDRMWTKGAYDFRFEIFSTNNEQPVIIYLPLRPDELWDFHIASSYRHSTWFRHSKYTYTIDPNKFTIKRVYLKNKQISFGKWDLSQEALERYISIYEEDKEARYETTVSHQVTKMTSWKVNGEIKFGFGKNSTTSGTVDGGVSGSTTKTETKAYKFERNEKDDNLGSIKIYFFDPIIDGKSGSNYLVHTYNTGYVSFGLAVE